MLRKNLIVFIYIAIVAYAVYFAYKFGFKPHYYNNINVTVAEDGVLDLTHFNFDSTHLIRLQGKAEFYWQQLLEPKDFLFSDSLKPNFLEIFGVWNGFQLGNQALKGQGYATYRLLIKVPKEAVYGFRFQEFDCAYKVWINGGTPYEIGKVAATKEEMVPSWKRLEAYVPSKDCQIELVLQVSNFHHRKGGPEDAIIFGPSELVKNYKEQQSAIGYALLGILFIMAIYHFVLYFYRPKDFSILLFGVLNFLMMIRHATTGEKIFLELFPTINWLPAVYIEYWSYMLAAPAALGFIYSLYPKILNRTFVLSMGWFGVLSCMIIFFTPSTVFSYSPLIYQLAIIVMAIYIFYALLIAVYHKCENSWVILGGYVFFFLAVLNDILYYNKWLGTSFIMHLGLFIMVLSQAFVLSKKNSQAFTDVEQLSIELEKANTDLEARVQKRTQEVVEQKGKIEEQKTELEAQAEQLKDTNEKLVELDKFKEEMIGMLVHDLKNPLNVVLHLTENDIVKYAGRQMLMLVQNLLDIKKYQDAQMDINISLNPLAQVVDNAIQQLNFMIKKKQIELINRIDTYGMYYFDPILIERVFINLLSNAAKYTPEGGFIQLDIYKYDTYIELCVSNNGSPIPDDQKELIFLPFGQYNPQKSGYTGSTGLGLTFCKMAITAHGGTIGVKDREPIGTTFYFTLPVNKNQSLFVEDKSPFYNGYLEETSPIKHLEKLLTDYDRNYLFIFAEQLAGYQIYEVSALKNILLMIDEDKSAGIYLWVKNMKEAIVGIKEDTYLELIKLVKI
ncbi:MAG: sensor histidine kinase [Salinivirgaceae bacterium]|nr:sensor histidine kinase [Salinivirgaceae bacterium]